MHNADSTLQTSVFNPISELKGELHFEITKKDCPYLSEVPRGEASKLLRKLIMRRTDDSVDKLLDITWLHHTYTLEVRQQKTYTLSPSNSAAYADSTI
jgi:hypothetical protein